MTSNTRQRIYDEFDKERSFQDKSWGGRTHDDLHSHQDWISIIQYYINVGEAYNFRDVLVKIGAVVVAAIESEDRLNTTESE